MSNKEEIVPANETGELDQQEMFADGGKSSGSNNNEVDVEVDYDQEAQPTAPRASLSAAKEPNVPPPSKRVAARPTEEYDDEDELNSPALTGNNKGFYPKQEEDEKDRKKKMALIGTAVLIALFAMFLILGLVFRQEDAVARSVVATDAPTIPVVVTPNPTEGLDYEYDPATPFPTTRPTPQPTLFPTQNPTPQPTQLSPTPTPAPVTGVPTRFPTPGPTGFVSPTASPIAPTFNPGPDSQSRLPCVEISAHENVTAGNLGNNNFQNYTLNEGRQVCADTFAGFDPSHEKRNYWTPYIGRKDCVVSPFVVGTDVCQNAGARRCTADELAQGAGQGTGCGGDNALIWSSTKCSVSDSNGYYQINLSLKGNAVFFLCQPDLTVPTITRCCGDLLLTDQEIVDAF